MSNLQFYLTIGIPTLAVLIGTLMNAVQFNSINARFSSIDNRFSSMDSRFSSLEGRVSNLEARFDARFNRHCSSP